MKNLFLLLAFLLALPISISAQSFLDKVLKGVEKTNKILDETDKMLGTGDGASSSGRKAGRIKGFQIVSPHPDLNVQITRCKGTGSTVLIDFLLTFEGDDKQINFNNNTIAFDDLGNQYRASDIWGGNENVNRYASTLLPSDVPIKCRMQIDNVKSNATLFKRINIYAGLDNPIMIYNLPITWKDNTATLPPSEPEVAPAQTSSGSLESGKEVNEDFAAFEEKFVANPRFQMLRIKFDNLGYNGEGEKWTQENWSIFKNKPSSLQESGEYKYEQKLSADQCVQRIWIPDSEFTLEYTYSKINGKWYLVKAFERF